MQIQKLKTFFQDLKGKHIPKKSNEQKPKRNLGTGFSIDCCDVVEGDCNSGSCV